LKRFHSTPDQRIRNKRRKFVKDFYDNKNVIEDIIERNNFRTIHPFDCGRSKCLVCHYDKLIFKNRNIEVLKSDEKMKEELKFIHEDFVIR